MYIDVEAPDVVTRGEQIGIKVTVFNNVYTEPDLEVNISTLFVLVLGTAEPSQR